MNNTRNQNNDLNSKYGRLKIAFNRVEKRTKYTKNEIRVYESGVCEIDVYDPFGVYRDTGIFSEEDLEKVMKYKWYKDNVGYLSTAIGDKKVRLHRLLFPDRLTDHYDSNKLNNLRDNLQPITHAENIAKITNKVVNPNGVTGVFHTKNDAWQASIEVKTKKKTKTFKNKKDAILMRYIWELNYWGKNSPQLHAIKKEYPRLAGGMTNGYKINEDINVVKDILAKLKTDPHCPCRLTKTRDTLCPCKEFREQTEAGECHCGLYYKVEV